MNEIIAIVCAINSYTHDKLTLEVSEQRDEEEEGGKKLRERERTKNIEMILR